MSAPIPSALSPVSPCPVELDTREILDHGQSMRSSMQKLRRNLESCPHCAMYTDCPILATLNAQVTAAVQDITDEWNLASTIC